MHRLAALGRETPLRSWYKHSHFESIGPVAAMCPKPLVADGSYLEGQIGEESFAGTEKSRIASGVSPLFVTDAL